ncbi:MAG TPA: tryptophan-rich sensory protein [Limnobacter sp.]|nr:tryptophan-rich sensory protein [Limnobacter sp.]
MRKFLELYQSASVASLVLHLISVWVLLGMSILLLAMSGSNFGANDQGSPLGAPWTPSGAFIGAVWSVLYSFMGIALWRANAAAPACRHTLRIAIATLTAFCLVWPFYAFDTTSRWPGLLGNLGILLLSINAVRVSWHGARQVAFLILPTAIWITIATASILDGARRYGW